jgi:hypothetical protein
MWSDKLFRDSASKKTVGFLRKKMDPVHVFNFVSTKKPWRNSMLFLPSGYVKEKY